MRMGFLHCVLNLIYPTAYLQGAQKNDPLAKCQYFGQNSIFWLDFLGVCRGDILASNLQIWF